MEYVLGYGNDQREWMSGKDWSGADSPDCATWFIPARAGVERVYSWMGIKNKKHELDPFKETERKFDIFII